MEASMHYMMLVAKLSPRTKSSCGIQFFLKAFKAVGIMKPLMTVMVSSQVDLLYGALQWKYLQSTIVTKTIMGH